MNINHLTTMANQIGSFYETMPNREEALAGLSDHIKKFWDPRMRRELLDHIDTAQETELHSIVLESLRLHREMF